MTRVGMMKRILGTAVLIAALAPVAQAETVRSKSFVGDIQRRAVTMQARDGSGSAQALQAYVSVTTVAGVVPGQAQIQAAGAFAAKAGCRDARDHERDDEPQRHGEEHPAAAPRNGRRIGS